MVIFREIIPKGYHLYHHIIEHYFVYLNPKKKKTNVLRYSVAESDSADAESGFEEADPGEAGNNVIKMVSRFVDKVRAFSLMIQVGRFLDRESVCGFVFSE